MTASIDIKNYSDSALIQKFRICHENAIVGELFQRYKHLVFGVCLKYLKEEQVAKDGVMEIFEKLITNLDKHTINNFKGWLYVVAKNHCLMHFRKKKKQVELPKNLTEEYTNAGVFNEEELLMTEVPVEFTTILHHDDEDKERLLSDMEVAIKELDDNQKTCVELFYLQEKSYQEVVDITGYSMKEVKSYIQNGKRNLKIRMTTNRTGNR